MPVLITAGLSPEAYRLERILNEAGGRKQILRTVVFADVSPLPELPGRASLILPHYNSPSFVHEVLKACLDLNITKVYPLKAGEVAELSKARALFSEYNVILVIPSDEWLNNHKVSGNAKAENIAVLEDGKLVAGTAFGANFPANKETGVFSRATIEQKIEYNLYLVNDAGI